MKKKKQNNIIFYVQFGSFVVFIFYFWFFHIPSLMVGNGQLGYPEKYLYIVYEFITLGSFGNHNMNLLLQS